MIYELDFTDKVKKQISIIKRSDVAVYTKFRPPILSQIITRQFRRPALNLSTENRY